MVIFHCNKCKKSFQVKKGFVPYHNRKKYCKKCCELVKKPKIKKTPDWLLELGVEK
jgi:hypothetical protein